jgi:O-antigen ligase
MMQVLANRGKVSNRLALAIVAIGSLAIGWMVAQGYFLWLGALGFAAALAFCLVRPIWASSLVLSFAFINPSLLPPVMELGQFTVRYVDGAAFLLIVAIFLRLLVQRYTVFEQEWWVIFKPLFPFLTYIGLSLGLVWIYVPDVLSASIASYARLMITILTGLLVCISIKEEKDLRFITKVIVMLAVASITIGSWEALIVPRKEMVIVSRYGGFLGYNTFGLVAGLLVLWSIIIYANRKPLLLWVIPLSSGLLGLFLSKSVSSILATVGGVLFFQAIFARKGLPQSTKVLKLVLGVIIGLVFTIWVMWLLRPADLIGFVNLSGGSWTQRLMIAYAAFQIFFAHPIFGVGWQASSTKAVISDPFLNKTLMQVFSQLPTHYFFLEHSTSLHNMYLQFLAELGIVGFSFFVYGVTRITRIVANILKDVPPQSPFRQLSLFCIMGLIYLLIWWNTNPLYGGQTESMLAVGFLSLLAALWKLQRQATNTRGSRNMDLPYKVPKKVKHQA